jgi:hypothetical protein
MKHKLDNTITFIRVAELLPTTEVKQYWVSPKLVHTWTQAPNRGESASLQVHISYL